MPTDVLKDMLRLSALSDEALDYESTLAILDEIEKREPHARLQTPEEAWAVFQAEYSSNESAFAHCAFDEGAQAKTRPVDAALTAHPPQNAAVPGSAGPASHGSRSAENTKTRRHRILRSLGYTAAAVIVLLLALFVPYARGATLWSAIAQWTADQFRFGTREASPNVELSDLHDELGYFGITAMLAPNWLPEGFALSDLTVLPTPHRIAFHAYYRYGERALTIQIVSLALPSVEDFERDDELMLIYERGGVWHYIMANYEQVVAIWAYENYECVISGNVTVDEIKRMIDSIYER
jgi:hypothetical protein